MSINWSEQLHKFFHFRFPEASKPISPGVYHFRKEADGNITRFHLRVEEDGSGLLLANSSIAARLSPSGVLIAKALLKGEDIGKIRESIHEHFRDVNEAQLQTDIEKLKRFVETLANPEDNYPIFNLDDAAISTPRRLFAPFHAQMPVASAEKINLLIQKLWESGIVHVTFAANSGTSAEEAVQNIERAEDTGMISGLRATATWLQTGNVLDSAAMAGVDYIIVPVLSADSETHDRFFGAGDFEKAMQTFADCKEIEVCPVAEIPLIRQNVNALENTLQVLHQNGVRNVQYYAVAGDQQSSALSPVEIIQAAALVEELAHRAEVRYVWLPPISCDGDLKSLLLDGPRTAGDVSIRVESDGSVYPPRGPMVSAGNLNSDSWKAIWHHPAFTRYRERVTSPTRCEICPGLEICAADCPGSSEGWATGVKA